VDEESTRPGDWLGPVFHICISVLTRFSNRNDM